MKRTVLTATVAACSLLLSAQSLAHPGGHYRRGSGGWGHGMYYNRMYSPSTVETVSGKVISINRFSPLQGMSNGIHLTLRTDAGEAVSVHLGPAWYLENQDLQLYPQDEIQVRGSRITFAEIPTLIATEVEKDDAVLQLRDENGYPVWSGWRQRW